MIQFKKTRIRRLMDMALLATLPWFGFHSPAMAQGDLLLAPQHGLIQSHFNINPAFVPAKRLTISIPPLLPPFPGPGLGFSISSNAFPLSDVIQPGKNGQTVIDTRSMLDHAKSMNTLSASFQADLLGVGYRLNDHHFLSLQLSNRAELNMEYSRDMLQLLLEGNGAEGILGEELTPVIHLDGIHYTSLGIGYTFTPEQGRIKAGLRIRYLAGQEHLRTQRSEIKFHTDANDFTLKGSADILIRTSGLQNGIFQGEQKPLSTDYLLGTGNHGTGIDAGVTWSINERWQFDASVNDLGFIRWRKDVTSYISNEPGAQVEFRGVDLTDYQDETITVQEAFDELTDSLSARFELTENNTGYTSMLNMRTTTSVTCALSEKQSVSLIIANTLYGRRVHPDISLSYSFTAGKWLKSSLAWSYIDRTAGNIGLFMSAQAGAFQWYLCSDNLMGIVFLDRYSGVPVPAYTRHTSLRVGFNLTLGQPAVTD